MLLSCLVDLWLPGVCNKIIPTSFTLFACVRVCVQVFSVSPLLYSLHLFYQSGVVAYQTSQQRITQVILKTNFDI